ncbi:putative porin [Hydrogenophaga palleronii]|uniref:Porin n=1 Tax=Hydrogenophaga palleronii TaxID=65655 RepID=A0ABU1WNN8_9BURK|nr:porin [Hydrogenophaga palleronii]MDR7150616.1 putative porin [Hydrogenophaga palleronii]
MTHLFKSLAIPCSVAALLLTAMSAHAQSSVTISGLVDVGVYRGFDKTTQLGTIQRSNIAFNGVEDLGGGLAATFKLSHRFDLDTGLQEGVGAKPFWHGESTVGVKGAWGSVRLGRALDAVWANDWAYDPWYNFNRIASPAWQYWHYNYTSDRTSNNGSPEYGRLSNGVFYDSPSFGGFAFHLSGSFEDSIGPDGGTSNNLGLSLNYDKGPISAMLAHSKNSSEDTVTFVGGKYTVGAWSVMGAYDRSKFEGAVDAIAKVYTVGTAYRLGAAEFKLGFGRLDASGAKSKFLGVGADYWLSKRTSVYVSAGRNNPSEGASTTAYGVGLAHSF